jgi:hypothetical protein
MIYWTFVILSILGCLVRPKEWPHSSSLSVTRGGGRRRLVMPWVHFVIVYVSQQPLGRLACAVPPGDAVPLWAYVSHRLRCSW